MTEAVKQQLIDMGLDYAGAMERFMNNDGLLERFLKKFPSDTNYSRLVEAMEQHDEESAFTAAHTLKGVCGNLSLQSLFGLVNVLVEELRVGNWDSAVEKMPALTEEYEKTIQVLNHIFE